MGQLELQNLTINYDNKPVIRDLSLAINDGEMVSLLGPSGVGKNYDPQSNCRLVASCLRKN